ncbi:hypothetical protein JHK85_050853 [Glycine max]|nr:hypothetical protein JHK85_050853 [Glycine max]
MVALVGAHTIGLSHFNQFSHRLFNFNKNSEIDPAYNPDYAAGLKKLCQNYTKDPSMSAFNDVITPTKFDNMYYKNLRKGMGLLATDSAMFDDSRSRPFVDRYADDEKKFFQDFARAMEKLSVLQVKTEGKGEVRSSSSSEGSSSGEASEEESSSNGAEIRTTAYVGNPRRSSFVWLALLLIITYFCSSIYHYQFQSMPVPLTAEEAAGKRGFSEIETFKHVRALTQLGPHPVGSEALQYVLTACENIKKTALWESRGLEIAVDV